MSPRCTTSARHETMTTLLLIIAAPDRKERQMLRAVKHLKVGDTVFLFRQTNMRQAGRTVTRNALSVMHAEHNGLTFHDGSGIVLHEDDMIECVPGELVTISNTIARILSDEPGVVLPGYSKSND